MPSSLVQAEWMVMTPSSTGGGEAACASDA